MLRPYEYSWGCRRALSLPIGVTALVLLGMLGSGLPPALANPPSPSVTASPPKEAVPAPPVTSALQRHVQQCNASAQAKQLYGKRREDYVRTCMATHPRANATRPLTASTGHSASGSAHSTVSSRSKASPAARGAASSAGSGASTSSSIGHTP